MKLLAISDLHLNHPANWQALLNLSPHPQDWLIVAGDVCESERRFQLAMTLLANRFARVFWTPGNHDLWTLPSDPNGLRGVAKYHRLVAICRSLGIFTPEDPFVRWPDGPFIAPTFTLYDYSFRPKHVSFEQAVAWAEETGVVCVDEVVLHPDPFPSRAAWCVTRCRYTEQRLAEVDGPLILINHFVLRQDLVYLWRIPRFSLWCGTKLTEEWHKRFPIQTVVYGHLHIRSTHERDRVRFEEVSLGYPQNWQPERGIEAYLRVILE
jgi:3',5'-cyclic AMP phosphodiesterase CpdA